jgi:hypothetical protein
MLGGFSAPAAAGPARHHIRLAQAPRATAPRLTVPPVILAEPASRARLEIGVAPAGAIPSRSFLRLKGLPPTVSLSEGYAISAGAWAVPLHALPNLHLNVPAGVSGKSEFSINLVAEDGAVLAEANSALIVAPVPAPAVAAKKAPPAAPAKTEAQAPKAPVLSPAERESAERFVVRGERELEEGNVAIARQFFLRAAEAGLARGALLLATTYDPRELQRMHVQGLQPDPAQARKWYERARELGAPEAEERLARLGAGG